MNKPNIDIAGEWELDPTEIASIFLHRKWGYDNGKGVYEIPKADTIKSMIGSLVEKLAEKESSGGGEWLQRGRFMVRRDPESKGVYDVYLNVGFAWSYDLMTDEEKAMFTDTEDNK